MRIVVFVQRTHLASNYAALWSEWVRAAYLYMSMWYRSPTTAQRLLRWRPVAGRWHIRRTTTQKDKNMKITTIARDTFIGIGLPLIYFGGLVLFGAMSTWAVLLYTLAFIALVVYLAYKF